MTGLIEPYGGALVDIRVTNPEANMSVRDPERLAGNYEMRNLIPVQYYVTVDMKRFKPYEGGRLKCAWRT